ncbi:MAG: hypothetical protein R2681_02455 [Pyrinomonadaceae bacterium]
MSVPKTRFLNFIPCSFCFFVLIFFAAQNVSASTIGGFVYGPGRAPIDQVDVELLNENYVVLERTRTNGLGRYMFSGMSDGRFYVRVLPFRFNLEDQTQEVIVNTLSLLGAGNGNFEQDFHLRFKQGGLGDTTTGVLFAQEVPSAAEELYKNAIKDLGDQKTNEGVRKLFEAIKIFPTYYAAAQRLGVELLMTKQYIEAAKYFVIAAEANPKSSRALYYLGFSLNKAGNDYNKAALLSLNKAFVLAPESWEVAYLIGKIYRQDGNYVESEKYLIKAKKSADKKNPSIHIELAQLYGNDLKQYDKAADELELYLKSSDKKDEKTKKQIADLRAKAKRGT